MVESPRIGRYPRPLSCFPSVFRDFQRRKTPFPNARKSGVWVDWPDLIETGDVFGPRSDHFGQLWSPDLDMPLPGMRIALTLERFNKRPW